MPGLLSYDLERRFVVKEYVKGVIATELIATGRAFQVLKYLTRMSRTAKTSALTRTIFRQIKSREGVLYEIDYEYNPYLEE